MLREQNRLSQEDLSTILYVLLVSCVKGIGVYDLH